MQNQEIAKILLDEEKKIDLEKDYEFSRDTYHDLIRSAMEVIDEMKELAKDSEHPRAYEVLFAGIKHTADINDKLVNLQRKMQVIRDSGVKDEEVFVEEDRVAFRGTVKELQMQLNHETIIDAEAEDDS